MRDWLSWAELHHPFLFWVSYSLLFGGIAVAIAAIAALLLT